ncbi:hypothetical protein [Pandoraea commovens]|uniref:Uncharacterized protein n=1 Tax=Pandoraea commovens TaxID=2508289 RepID=A0ABY5QG61_9BURK|nr:hypothetical protein [Pandoraea commovens]UVA79584.1 hypothetical protein NTU39_00625 [Pandoraea commovens]
MENAINSGLSPIQPHSPPEDVQRSSSEGAGVAGNLVGAKQASSDAALRPGSTYIGDPLPFQNVDFSKIFDVWKQVSDRPTKGSLESQVAELKAAIGAELASSQDMKASAKSLMRELLWRIDELPENLRGRGLETVLESFEQLMSKAWFDDVLPQVIASFDGPEWLEKFPESARRTVQLFMDSVENS